MYIISAILAFSILIIVHELGHFTLAKLNGVMVEEFSLGMGPKLFSISGKETKYSIRLLPIGGFVKMLGDDSKCDDPRAFNNKHPLRKLSIVAAGPIMNILLAIVFFAISSNRGLIVPTVGEIQKNMPAQTAGIMHGDKLTKFNGKNINQWDDFLLGMYDNKGEEIVITVKRDNQTIPFTLKPIYNEKEKRYMIGLGGTLEKPTFSEAVTYGFKETGLMVKMTGTFFKTLFTGKANMNDVGGPISVIRLTGEAAKSGLYVLMSVAGFISIQLGLFNIIPFPALDGGYIFLYLYQLITRKEFDDNTLGIINYIGFVLLMTLMVLVVFKDIMHPMKF